MSITVRCACGKKYQLKDDAAGKKFKCKECSEVVKVPDEQIDDLEDVDEEEDDWDDGEMKLPVRKKKKKSSKAASMAKGIAWEAAKGAPVIFLQITGMIFGVSGYITGGLYLILAAFGLIGVNLIVIVGGATMALLSFLGARGAMGFGFKVSGDTEWKGNGSIIAGIIVVNCCIGLPVILIFLVGMAMK
ncbi:MAG: hypothetical protein JWN70_2529 [Planctomycetaceae bacterium]|nr:hypothetical protein [Planctomycetaceae bacterium]